MTDAQATAGAATRTPWHLWAVGVLSALWNCGGVFDFTMTHIGGSEYMAAFTPEQIAWFNNFPLWSRITWAMGVFGALAGSLLILLRSHWAVTAYILSFAGLVIGTLYQFAISHIPASLNTPGNWGFTAALWIVAILQLRYAQRMRTKGILR